MFKARVVATTRLTTAALAVAFFVVVTGVVAGALARSFPNNWLLGPVSWKVMALPIAVVLAVFVVWFLLGTGRWVPGGGRQEESVEPFRDAPTGAVHGVASLTVVERNGPPTAPLPVPPEPRRGQ